MDPGKNYQYTVTARWMKDGKMVEQERTGPGAGRPGCDGQLPVEHRKSRCRRKSGNHRRDDKRGTRRNFGSSPRPLLYSLAMLDSPVL